MKHAVLEFLMCGTIGMYCVVRCVALMPEIIRMATHAVALATERRRQIDEVIEEGGLPEPVE